MFLVFLILAAWLLSLSPTYAQNDGFQVGCGGLTVQQSDPIVAPGKQSSHTHFIVGGTDFARTESNQAAVNSKATTCSQTLDHSNYWIPALYHHNRNGTYTLLRRQFQDTEIYYQDRACNYTADLKYCDYHKSTLTNLGLRMVAGNPSRCTYNASDFSNKATSHNCIFLNGRKPDYMVNKLPQELCDVIRSQVYFPSCWDGVLEADSPNHSQHMAYPAYGVGDGDYNRGVCPQSHPIAIYSILYEFLWETNQVKTAEFNEWVYSMNDTTGYGLHGDFLNGWTDQARLRDAMRTCSGYNRNLTVDDPGCSLRVTKTPIQKNFSLFNKTETPVPGDNVGWNGNLTSLPGQTGPRVCSA